MNSKERPAAIDGKPNVSRRFPVGKRFKIFYNDRNINNMGIEIRSIVDDMFIVFKTSKGRYVMEPVTYFDFIEKDGILKAV